MLDLKVIDGAVDAPYCMGIYGPGGAGKTWLASYAEDPMFIPLEAGTNLVPAKKFNQRPKTIDDFFEMMRWLIKNPTTCKTAVVDSLGFFQSLVYADIIKKNPTTGGENPRPINSIVDYGYHAGYAMALPYWEKLLAGVDALQAKGMNVILITHSQLKNAKTETGDSYKVTDFALQSSSNGDVCELLRRRLDVCLYIKSTAKTGKRAGGFGGSTTVPMVGSRPETIVYTRATSSFFAKVRSSNEKSIRDYYEIDPNNIDQTSKQIIEAVTR